MATKLPSYQATKEAIWMIKLMKELRYMKEKEGTYHPYGFFGSLRTCQVFGLDR
jgi:hypothetical protein